MTMRFNKISPLIATVLATGIGTAGFVGGKLSKAPVYNLVANFEEGSQHAAGLREGYSIGLRVGSAARPDSLSPLRLTEHAEFYAQMCGDASISEEQRRVAQILHNACYIALGIETGNDHMAKTHLKQQVELCDGADPFLLKLFRPIPPSLEAPPLEFVPVDSLPPPLYRLF